MAYSPTITKYAQSIHLVIKNRYLDDIEDDDGQIFIDQVLDWTNQYLEELENITDAAGQPVYWNYLRTTNYVLGSPVLDQNTLALTDAVANVVAAPDRPIEIIGTDGKV